MKTERYDANISFPSLHSFSETNGVCWLLLYIVHNDQPLEFLKICEKTILRALCSYINSFIENESSIAAKTCSCCNKISK